MQQTAHSPWLQQQKQSITDNFLNSLWRDLLLLSLVVLPVSMTRIFVTGWLNLYAMHLVVVSVVVATAMLRQRLSVPVKGFLAVSIMFVLGVGGLLNFGLAANGAFWLLCGCLIASFIYEKHTVLLIAGLALVIFCGVFAGYTTGYFQAQTDLNQYMQTLSAWLNFLLTAILMVFTVHRAIAARQQQMFATTQHQYRQWLDDLPLALEVVDLQQKSYYRNHAALALFGQDDSGDFPLQFRAQLLDKTSKIPLKPAELPAVAALRGENVFIAAATLQTHQQTRVVRCWGWPGYLENAEIGYGITVFEDITQQSMAEQFKNEFIANVSHELRTPLTAIRGSIGLMLGGALGDLPKRTEDMARICQQNSERLLFLVNDLLDMQKIEQGQLEVHMIPVDASILLQECLQNMQSYAQEFGAKLVLNDQAPHAVISVDSDRLQQVIANLIANAVKFSPKNSVVMLSIRCEDQQLVIGVQDQGCGIPSDFVSKIFEPFVQREQQNAKPHSGTGLGLSISKKLVDHMHGQISLQSEEGFGTTVELRFALLVEP